MAIHSTNDRVTLVLVSSLGLLSMKIEAFSSTPTPISSSTHHTPTSTSTSTATPPATEQNELTNHLSYAALGTSSNFVPRRLLSSGWDGIPTRLQCARRSRAEFPDSRGFLYNETTTLCTPVHSLQARNATPPMDLISAEEGDLFLSFICKGDFEMYDYNGSTQLACLKLSTLSLNYDTATATCSAWGGHLASAKTSAKVQLISSFTSYESLWVGADDRDKEGIYVWQIDGESTTQGDLPFGPGEPSGGSEHCLRYRWQTQKLNDANCDGSSRFVCEILMPTLTSFGGL